MFQDEDGQKEKKPRLSETNVKHGPRTFDTELECQHIRSFYRPTKKPVISEDYTVSNTGTDGNSLLEEYRKLDIAWLLSRVDLSQVSSGKDFINQKNSASLFGVLLMLFCVMIMFH